MFFIIFAKPTIYLVSGKLFERAILPMEIIMPTLLLIGLSNITGIQILIPMGKEKYVLYSEIAGAVINLIINAILIPRLGASGAAIGTVSAELVVLAYQMCILKKDLGKLFGGAEIWKSVTAVCLASVASMAILPEQSFNISDAPCRGNCILPDIWNCASGFEGAHRM